MAEFSSSCDIIDTRDLIAKVDELESDIDSLKDEVSDKNDELAELQDDLDAAVDDLEVENAEEAIEDLQNEIASLSEQIEELEEELEPIKAFHDEAEECSRAFRYGESLINEDYFETYAQELARNIGAITGDEVWPATHIDWEKAVEDLQQDYTYITYDVTDFWIRCS